MQREIGDRLAKLLLSGQVHDGGTVTVDTDEDPAGGLVLRVEG